MTTPSQLAKEYASAHGFRIMPVERRYHVSHGLSLTFVADVGGYPAALNAMKAHVAAREVTPAGVVLPSIDAGPVTTANVAPLQECAAYDSGCQYSANGMNGEIQCKYCGAPLLDELVSETRKVLPGINDELAVVIASAHAAVIANVEAQIKALTPTTKDNAIKKLRGPGDVGDVKYWREPTKVDGDEADRYYDNAPLHVRERIRELAKAMRPGGRWHVTFNGSIVTRVGHATRADALKLVRSWFNDYEPYRTNWRKARVTIIYVE